MMTVRTNIDRVWFTGFALLLTGLLATGTSCTPDVPQDELEERTSVVFDSEQGFIPLPSTAALDEEGTLPDLDSIEEESAEGDFARWLTTLHGWLPASGIEIPVGGAIDTDSLTTDAFRVYELPDDGDPIPLTVESVTFTPESETPEGEPALITASVEGGYKLDTRYGYVMTNAVQDTSGNALLAPQALFFATAETPLLQEDGTPNFSALESLPEETRQQLVALQNLYSPTVSAAANDPDNPVARGDIVAVSQWYTARDTFLLFDPTAGVAPFPISSLIGEDGTVNLPTEGQEGIALALLEELNTRTGFSTTAEAWLPVAGPIDPESITNDNFKFAKLITEYEEDDFEVIYEPDMNIIRVKPNVPLQFEQTQVVLTNETLTDPDGMPVKADQVFVLLRTPYDLVDDDGNSTVSLVSDEQAQALQAAKDGGIEDLVGLAAPVLGFQRTNLAAGTGFDTPDPTLALRDARARAVYETDEAGNTEATIDGTAEMDPTDNIGMRIQAEFTSQSFVDENGVLQTDPSETTVPITVTLPKEADCTAPYDIAIVQHGLGSSRANASAAFADALAASDYCLATVAMDFPLHGDRATGGTSGEGYLSENLVATKNYMLQSVVDQHVLTEVLLADGLEGLIDDDMSTDMLNSTEFGYVGTSLGGILGSNFVATSTAVKQAVFTVAGAKFTEILLEGSIGEDLAAALPGEEGMFERYQVVQFIQWAADPVEPWNFAKHTTASPLPVRNYNGSEFSDGSAVDEASVLVQMAEGDAVVPNSTTQRLAAALDVELDDTTFTGVDHGFLNTDSAEATCAKNQAAQWIVSGLDGNAELTPELENACN